MWPEQKVSNAIRDFLQPKIFCDHNNCFNKTYSNYFTIAHRNGNKMRISCRKWLVRTGLVYISLMFEFGIVLLCLITSVKSSVGPSAVSIVSLKCLSSPKNRCGFQNGQRCRVLFLLQWYDSSNCGQCLLYLMAQTTTFFCFWHWNIQILIFHTDGNTADAILFCTLIQWIIGMIFSAIAFFICLPAIDVGCLRTGHPGFVCVLCIKTQFLVTISDICKNIRKPSTPGYVDSDFEIKFLNKFYTSCLHSWF